ncbi:MAG TPA: hypothetical protein VFB46_08685, partial [Gemmatimonadaceae bacterium]|nr:hypothetical protein [Gemmatimonadaceae bacterium]
RLAGLPPAVLTRARTILSRLEGGHLVASSASDERPRKSDEQLGLFQPGVSHPVLDRLKAIDPNAMTPLEALKLLAELREKVDGE